MHTHIHSHYTHILYTPTYTHLYTIHTYIIHPQPTHTPGNTHILKCILLQSVWQINFNIQIQNNKYRFTAFTRNHSNNIVNKIFFTKTSEKVHTCHTNNLIQQMSADNSYVISWEAVPWPWQITSSWCWRVRIEGTGPGKTWKVSKSNMTDVDIYKKKQIDQLLNHSYSIL